MSLSSMAQEGALRPRGARAEVPPPDVGLVAERAAEEALAAVAGGASEEAAKEAGRRAALESRPAAAPPPSVSSGPLSQLVKYIPTETITLYIAIQAALGDIDAPAGGDVSDADFTSRWVWLGIMLAGTVLLAVGLSYRAQKDAGRDFRLPWFDVTAAGLAFLVWSLSLPSTPLQSWSEFDYSAWNGVIILGGTIVIAAAAYVFNQNVAWKKVYDEPAR